MTLKEIPPITLLNKFPSPYIKLTIDMACGYLAKPEASYIIVGV